MQSLELQSNKRVCGVQLTWFVCLNTLWPVCCSHCWFDKWGDRGWRWLKYRGQTSEPSAVMAWHVCNELFNYCAGVFFLCICTFLYFLCLILVDLALILLELCWVKEYFWVGFCVFDLFFKVCLFLKIAYFYCALFFCVVKTHFFLTVHLWLCVLWLCSSLQMYKASSSSFGCFVWRSSVKDGEES